MSADKKFLVNIDLGGNQIKNVVVHKGATAPANGIIGQLWYDTTNNKLNICVQQGSGVAWKPLATGDAVGNGTITIKQEGISTDQTFTINQSGNTTINLNDTKNTVGVGGVTTNTEYTLAGLVSSTSGTYSQSYSNSDVTVTKKGQIESVLKVSGSLRSSGSGGDIYVSGDAEGFVYEGAWTQNEEKTAQLPPNGGTLATTDDITITGASNGLKVESKTVKHTNSVTKLETVSLKKISYDEYGHVTGSSNVTGSDLPSGIPQAKVSAQLSGSNTLSDDIANLNSRINDIGSLGRYLSGWDATLGKPTTEPNTKPYAYKTGDYYIISVTAADKETTSVNFKPSGSSYTGAASTTRETQAIDHGDIYKYDGSTWELFKQTDVPVIPIANSNNLGVVKSSESEGNVSVNGDTGIMSVNGWSKVVKSGSSVALTGDVTGSSTVSNTGTVSVATTIGTGKVTNDMLAGSIVNGKLANSSITVDGKSVSLGGSVTTNDTKNTVGIGATAKTTKYYLAGLVSSTSGTYSTSYLNNHVSVTKEDDTYSQLQISGSLRSNGNGNEIVISASDEGIIYSGQFTQDEEQTLSLPAQGGTIATTSDVPSYEKVSLTFTVNAGKGTADIAIANGVPIAIYDSSNEQVECSIKAVWNASNKIEKHQVSLNASTAPTGMYAMVIKKLQN